MILFGFTFDKVVFDIGSFLQMDGIVLLKVRMEFWRSTGQGALAR
jgi:hypothetical protein